MLDSIINVKLFTVPNMVAIGAILFFWSYAVYVFHQKD